MKVKGENPMKAARRKTFTGLLVLIMVLSLFPVSAYAYVGAMTQNAGGVTAGQKDGYYYLTNSYIGFYIRPDGKLTTVPSQRTLSDAMGMGATEAHAFYKQTKGGDIWRTDWNSEVGANSSSVTIDSTDPANPKLRQVLTVPAYNATVTITYELVRLDKGKTTDTTGAIIGGDSEDSGRTWGVLASASISNQPDPNTRVLWVTKHSFFGGVGHSLLGTVSLDRCKTTYDSNNQETRTYFSGPISSGLSRVGTDDISEVFTDSFSYANQFVAMEGYMNAKGDMWDGTKWVPSLISGIRGHWNNYSSAVTYAPASNSLLTVEHEFSGDEAYALWGFRELYATGESNIPPDPANIPTDATCVGIVNDRGNLSAHAAKNEAALKSSYGNKLAAVFRGAFRQESGNFIFGNGVAQLSPSLTATWTEGSGGLTVAANGTVTARNVHLSAPTFKFYKPKSNNDSSLRFNYDGQKLVVGMTPENNAAILHIDIPGATCKVESVTADLTGTLVFKGEMSISTPALDAANITMTRLGMGWKNQRFSLAGIEASGAVDMRQLLGLDVGSASAEINSFPGEERYAFELEVNVFDMFEAEGELELKRIFNGALIPNTLKFKVASEVGVPLVPPVVVAELNGVGGGFEGLADTINGDFFAIPPLRLTVSAKGSVLETIEGWYTVLIGAGYYKASLTNGKLLEMDIIDEYSWYMELAGDIRNYQGTEYRGLKVGGGMKIDLSIPSSDKPFIQAGGEFNASAFAGLNSYTNPTYAYLVLGADGKIYGLVQIPAEAWFIGRDLKLASAEVAFVLGGQTTVQVTNTSFGNAVKDAFGNISGYGGVAYTGNLIGFPFRIYYIFQDKEVGIEVGKFLGELDPFDPSPYSVRKLPLLDVATGKQVGIMVMNDNLILLASSGANVLGGIPPLVIAAVGTNDAADKGVTITQQDASERSYQIVIDDSAPDPRYLAFSLVPKNWDGTTESFMNSLTVQDSVYSPLTLVPAVFNDNNEITNNDTANVVVGSDRLTLKLPRKGTWTVSSDASAFDISCYYASPFATLTGMNLTTGGQPDPGSATATLNGTAVDMKSQTKYALRTYLGSKKGGTDYLLSQSDVPPTGGIDETFSLSGGVAPTGSYYVTTVLLEEITGDFNGDGVSESAYVTTDTFAFDATVDYTNSEQPNPPTDVSLTAIGSELMRVQWKGPATGPSVDGYYLGLYQKEGSQWMETGANYLLKAGKLTPDANGYYSYDMAVTAGDKSLHLQPDKTYKVGITAFRYLADEDNDGTNDSLPAKSGEAESTEQFLPKATYPVLSYSPAPSSDGDSMKLLCVKGAVQVTVTSDVDADITVTRMDTDATVAETSGPAKTLTFDTPADFTGALNLKITAKDADGDVAVDYIGLRFDTVAPLITMDKDSFAANLITGTFLATGVTESGARVSVTDIVAGDGTSGAQLDANEVTADQNGSFTITGTLNPQDQEHGLSVGNSATLILQAADAADNVSVGFTEIVARADKALVSVTPPRAITGVASGTAKTAEALGLPSTVILVTDGGEVSASVTWDVASSSYDPGSTARQTFTVHGTVTLPAGVANPNGVSLDVSIDVTVKQMETIVGGEDEPSDSSTSSHPTIIQADPSGSILAGSLRFAAEAAGRGGTVTVETSGNSVSVTGEGLQYLINNGCALRLNTGSGSMLISAEALAGLKIKPESRVEFSLSRPRTFSDPELQALADAGYPVYEISILVDGKAVHKLAGTIAVTLKDGAFAALSVARGLKVIHALDGGAYRDVAYTLADGTLSFTLTSLSHILVLDSERAAELLKNPFADVTSTDWFLPNVLYVYQTGLMMGTGSNMFGPNTAMTRAMVVTVLYRLSGDSGSYVNPFTDVPSGAWYENAVAWAAANKIARGTGDGCFAPDKEVTREQVAVFMHNYAKYKGYDVSSGEDTNILSYNDALSISDYAYAALQWACAAGIIKGDAVGNLNPQGFATRAEVAAMLQRFVEKCE